MTDTTKPADEIPTPDYDARERAHDKERAAIMATVERFAIALERIATAAERIAKRIDPG